MSANVYPVMIVLALVGCSSTSFNANAGKSPTSKSGDATNGGQGNGASKASGLSTPGDNVSSSNPASGGSQATGTSTGGDKGGNPDQSDLLAGKDGGKDGGGEVGKDGDKDGGKFGKGGVVVGPNGGVLNPNATGSDPSGVGAAISTNGDGVTPFNKQLMGDPDKTKIIGRLKGQEGDLTPHQRESIKNCMKLWGWAHPFAIGRTRPDKIIFGNIEVGPANRLIDMVLGTEFSGITDEEVTANPSLILVIASINLAATNFILPEVTYKFHNPKGWYCVDFSLDIASSLKVELKKGAHLADSHFNLSIFSDSQAVAAAQVSILSRMKVETIP